MFTYVAKNGRGDRMNDSTAGTNSSPRDSCSPDSNPEEHQTTTNSQCDPCETSDGNAVYVPGDEFQEHSDESGEIVDRYNPKYGLKATFYINSK